MIPGQPGGPPQTNQFPSQPPTAYGAPPAQPPAQPRFGAAPSPAPPSGPPGYGPPPPTVPQQVGAGPPPPSPQFPPQQAQGYPPQQQHGQPPQVMQDELKRLRKFEAFTCRPDAGAFWWLVVGRPVLDSVHVMCVCTRSRLLPHLCQRFGLYLTSCTLKMLGWVACRRSGYLYSTHYVMNPTPGGAARVRERTVTRPS